MKLANKSNFDKTKVELFITKDVDRLVTGQHQEDIKIAHLENEVSFWNTRVDTLTSTMPMSTDRIEALEHDIAELNQTVSEIPNVRKVTPRKLAFNDAKKGEGQKRAGSKAVRQPTDAATERTRVEKRKVEETEAEVAKKDKRTSTAEEEEEVRLKRRSTDSKEQQNVLRKSLQVLLRLPLKLLRRIRRRQ